MPWAVAAATIGAGAGIFEGSQAADAQKSAANSANKTQMAMFDKTQANLSPFVSGGQDSMKALMAALGIGGGGANGGQGNFNTDFLRNSPGYQFQEGQGIDAIDNAASARGGVNSGSTLKALDQFGQGLADTTWQQYLGNLSDTSKIGESAAAQTGSFGAGAANQVSANQIGVGNVNAAQSVGQGQNITNLFNNPQVLAALKGMTGGGDNYAGLYPV